MNIFEDRSQRHDIDFSSILLKVVSCGAHSRPGLGHMLVWLQSCSEPVSAAQTNDLQNHFVRGLRKPHEQRGCTSVLEFCRHTTTWGVL
jgi:hypothetical protein